jgi:hypothetical protein
MEEACQRLEQTELSVEQISYSLGFRDPGYFNRFFKRQAGMSPGAYRGMSARLSPANASPSFAAWPRRQEPEEQQPNPCRIAIAPPIATVGAKVNAFREAKRMPTGIGGHAISRRNKVAGTLPNWAGRVRTSLSARTA